jgi:hypothetical protein
LAVKPVAKIAATAKKSTEIKKSNTSENYASGGGVKAVPAK